VILKCQQHTLLCEALRRYTRFGIGDGKSLTEAWTGLGFTSYYKIALETGLMTYIDGDKPYPRILHWFRLTDKGAKIVQNWLDLGFTYEDIENGKLPPLKINGNGDR